MIGAGLFPSDFTSNVDDFPRPQFWCLVHTLQKSIVLKSGVYMRWNLTEVAYHESLDLYCKINVILIICIFWAQEKTISIQEEGAINDCNSVFKSFVFVLFRELLFFVIFKKKLWWEFDFETNKTPFSWLKYHIKKWRFTGMLFQLNYLSQF